MYAEGEGLRGRREEARDERVLCWFEKYGEEGYGLQRDEGKRRKVGDEQMRWEMRESVFLLCRKGKYFPWIKANFWVDRHVKENTFL